MSRTLEIIFLIGCSVVGWSLNAPEGTGLKEAVKCSVRLVALAQDNIASNTARLTGAIGSLRLE
jgi:hypothetical protein